MVQVEETECLGVSRRSFAVQGCWDKTGDSWEDSVAILCIRYGGLCGSISNLSTYRKQCQDLVACLYAISLTRQLMPKS